MNKTIVDVKGIGPTSAALLIEVGIRTIEDLATASLAELTAIQGFSDIRAAKVIEEAKALLTKEEKPAVPKKAKDTETSAKKRKKASKEKKGKKDDKKKAKKNKGSDNKKERKKSKKKK